MFNRSQKLIIPSREDALVGRTEKIRVSARHFVLNNKIEGPFDVGIERAVFGAGCFWGVEKKFWALDGVLSTSVGYCGGYTANPSYEEVCSGLTGHNEVVMIIFSPEKVDYWSLLQMFWEIHDPTQGMRQGNDVGTQYRSGIYFTNQAQESAAEKSLKSYGQILANNGYSPITTEIDTLSEFYFAEDYHQQYLAKNPTGYCGLGGTGFSFETKFADC